MESAGVKILLAIHNVYTDPTSGAARSMRTLVEWLAEAGHEARVLATARFDARPPESIEDHLAGLGVPLEDVPSPGPCRVVRFTLDGIPVTTLLTQHHQMYPPDYPEAVQFLGLYEQELDRFAPDVLHTYGGHQVIVNLLRQARERGVISTVSIQNYGYEDRRWFSDVDSVLMTSPYLGAYYWDRIGLISTGVPSPIRWAEVIPEKHDPEFLTFVNPSLHKGAALFARLADMLGARRPDIPILVVQSASGGELLKRFPGIDLARYRHILAGPPTSNPADFFGLTRLLLVPSVFAEPLGRVAAEALINGIPPLVSDRGALAETVGAGGRVLPLPGWMEPRSMRLPSESEARPWFDAVCELWDNAETYARLSALAREEAERMYGEGTLKAVYLGWLDGLKRGQSVLAAPGGQASAAGSSFFHLQTRPGSTWPPLPEPKASPVWAAYLELDRTQWLPAEEVGRLQLTQVHALLEHCIENVPYYRDVLTAAGIDPAAVQTFEDFRRIPLLRRLTYQDRYPDFKAQRLPPGTVEMGTCGSSGTSGVPVEVVQTNVVRLWWLAFCLRDLQWSDIDPRGSLASIRATYATGEKLQRLLQGEASPSWHPDLGTFLQMGPSFLLDIHQDPVQQLEWLRRVRPSYLLTYPTNLEYLTGLVRNDGKKLPGLRAIQVFGEMLDEPVRAQIESTFGVPTRNMYSCSEAGYLASPCPEGHGMHVHAENVLLEVLDEAGQPCAPGQTGRVVLTTLHNFATPLIRYEILDDATVGPAACPCGRGLPLLTRVLGRQFPLLHLPGGGRKSPVNLITRCRKMDVLHQFQFVQKAPDHVVVVGVPNPRWTAEQAEAIREIVRDELGAPVRVDVQVRQRVDLPPGGKWKVVVVEVGA